MPDNGEQRHGAGGVTRSSSAALRPRRKSRAARVAILLTAAACLAALFCRAPLRGRYWAWRLSRAASPAEQSIYVGALCNAGDAARWGVHALAADPRAEVRQFGVLVAQHRRGWGRDLLLAALGDSDPGVRSLAAAGLALQRDAAVLPVLEQLYRGADEDAAVSACRALELLGTDDAVAALARLAAEPATPTRVAALIDALEGVGTPVCVSPLLQVLADERACTAPTRAERLLAELPPEVRTRIAALAPQSAASIRSALAPPSSPRPATLAERAAAAVARITGIDRAFSADVPAPDRAAARREWSEWLAMHVGSK
ncbi:MAG: HEAT repeat domain-containing protein [Planctomycetota bacterium]